MTTQAKKPLGLQENSNAAYVPIPLSVSEEQKEHELNWQEICTTWRTSPKSTSLPSKVKERLGDMGFKVGHKIRHVTSLGTFFYPAAYDADFTNIFMAWFFEIDDEIDEAKRDDSEDFIQGIKDVCQDLKGPGSPFELLTQELINLARGLASGRPRLLKRFIGDLLDWLDSINPTQKETYVRSYKNLRIINVGAVPTLSGGEVLLGFDLSDEFNNNPYVQMLRLEVSYHIAVLNDIVSVHQDIAQEKECNYVLLGEADTLDGQKQLLFEELKKSEAKMKDLSRLLLETTPALPDSTQAKTKYIQYCQDIVGGHVEWALLTERYQTKSVFQVPTQMNSETKN